MLKASDGKRKGFVIGDATNSKRPTQDTPKEDFILCEVCEKFIGKLESKFANDAFYKIPKLSKTAISTDIDLVYCCDLPYLDFKLFSYSLLFRALISEIEIFANCELPNELLKPMKQSLIDEKLHIDIPVLVLKSKADTQPTKNVYFALSGAGKTEGVHILFINEFVFIFGYNNLDAFKIFPKICVNSDSAECVKISLLNNNLWDVFRSTLLDIVVQQELTNRKS